MAFKVNYGLERAERNRAKQAKKDAKLRNRNSGTGTDTGGDDTTAPEQQSPATETTEPGNVPPDSGT